MLGSLLAPVELAIPKLDVPAVQLFHVQYEEAPALYSAKNTVYSIDGLAHSKNNISGRLQLESQAAMLFNLTAGSIHLNVVEKSWGGKLLAFSLQLLCIHQFFQFVACIFFISLDCTITV